MLLHYLCKAWVVHMVVVIVRYNYSINDRDILNVTRCLSVSLWAQPGKWTTLFAENRVEENTAARKFDKVAGMPEPSSPKSIRSPVSQKCWPHDCYRWGFGVWRIRYA